MFNEAACLDVTMWANILEIYRILNQSWKREMTEVCSSMHHFNLQRSSICSCEYAYWIAGMWFCVRNTLMAGSTKKNCTNLKREFEMLYIWPQLLLSASVSKLLLSVYNKFSLIWLNHFLCIFPTFRKLKISPSLRWVMRKPTKAKWIVDWLL